MAALLHARELTPLAPDQLPSFRQQRYQGDAMDLPLSAFDDESQQRLQQLYGLLSELRQLIEPRADASPTLAALLQLMAAHPWKHLISEMVQLRLRSEAEIEPLRASQVLHDLRGGALQAIMFILQFAELGILNDNDMLRLWLLCRDHLKIFRNAVAEIDPAGMAHDQASHLHHIDLVVAKWQQAVYAMPDARATISVDSAFDGYIAERCLEFAALDRVLYNLINNAVRHSPDGEVALALLPIPSAEPTQLRIGVANRLTTTQVEQLQKLVAGRLPRLFEGGLTIGGSGHGLRICADFVLRAYGIASLEHALEAGYLGINQDDERIIFWVHWPITGE